MQISSYTPALRSATAADLRSIEATGQPAPPYQDHFTPSSVGWTPPPSGFVYRSAEALRNFG